MFRSRRRLFEAAEVCEIVSRRCGLGRIRTRWQRRRRWCSGWNGRGRLDIRSGRRPVRDCAALGPDAAAHENAAQENHHRHDRRGHEEKHQLFPVQLDFVEGVVLSLRHNHCDFSTLALVISGLRASRVTVGHPSRPGRAPAPDPVRRAPRRDPSPGGTLRRARRAPRHFRRSRPRP